MAPDACLLVARVFGDEPNAVAPTHVTNRAIEWCADQGANIINLSYGTSVHSTNSETILSRLQEEGVLVVASSGNSGNALHSYPASYPQVISVSNVDDQNERYRTSQYNSQVDLCAPGVDVESTVPTVGLQDGSGNTYSVEYMEYSGVVTEPLTARPVICQGNFVCTQASGAICLIELPASTSIRYEEQLLNCQAGGGLGAVLHGNVGSSSIPLQHLDSGTNVNIPVVKATMLDGFRMRQQSSLTIDLQAPGYTTKIGTSMAAPHVTGVAALIWAAFPRCTNLDVREAMEQTALDLGQDVGLSGRDNFYGHGLVQAYDAYAYLSQMPCAIEVTEDDQGDGNPDDSDTPDEGNVDSAGDPEDEPSARQYSEFPYDIPQRAARKYKFLREVGDRGRGVQRG